eukprot:CAMPEP_0201486624 /NCGR_PEP_ID=MMETSP0151_2-20130828/10678_1 /ASSEMBLY_ACC=CAM_ASM_000257 /TAXON_ID=200890 /ORGANISM="Paramoeba atlantica, Strain 621/1 / CCAP 1560/9" /LENGTH=73 /DNA_ID=CAMNT_0047871367 /DNA_START=705 /DNA_END=926 /DNA_ORIENTATION=-
MTNEFQENWETGRKDFVVHFVGTLLIGVWMEEEAFFGSMVKRTNKEREKMKREKMKGEKMKREKTKGVQMKNS